MLKNFILLLLLHLLSAESGRGHEIHPLVSKGGSARLSGGALGGVIGKIDKLSDYKNDEVILRTCRKYGEVPIR